MKKTIYLATLSLMSIGIFTSAIKYSSAYADAINGTSATSDQQQNNNNANEDNNENEENNQYNYEVTSSRDHYMMKVLNGTSYLWENPYKPGVKYLGNTNKINGLTVQLNQKAVSQSETYYQISRKGKNYGWINSKALGNISTYVLPYTYSSQLYPTLAPNACEAISLKMALSVKGSADNLSTKTFIDNMPRSSNIHKGFRGNPYKHNPTNVSWTILPAPLTKYGKQYNSNTANISGYHKDQIIKEIKRGNAVAFAGSRNMRGKATGHMLTIVGYRYGQFLVADPYKYAGDGNKIFWVSTSRFQQVYDQYNRYAVVVR
ncbi:C39 family peptidase [Apilactobacillus xinyiensis]|uniref:C39 family peptidase n=1 Tax=Apilactobacillus xinyiensis TaxID=2841032 RepID=UPI001C7DC55A|nr:C39 family peptidase [Apilactobacillus xinyiensis]MCL0312460.1 C39 family peptidase [Apilactobacillus xinyiensis]MCL0318569.1 C39 family peptidase [Apilactobacillus xinyiensis]